MDIQLKYDQALDVIVGLSSDIQELKQKNEQLKEVINKFEEALTKEIEGNKAISGNGVRGNTFQDGVTLGLETAKSMYLVRVIQKVIRID